MRLDARLGFSRPVQKPLLSEKKKNCKDRINFAKEHVKSIEK